MACGGCRRGKSNSGTRVKTRKKTIKTVNIEATAVSSPADTTERKKKCSKCPFNTSSGLSGRCKKSNRLIARAIMDIRYKCPIKRF